jgi:heavy metal translocating P-type ATPase
MVKTTAGVCDLCGLPLRYQKFDATFSGKSFRFCCMGCKQVFLMLLAAPDAGDPATFQETELFKKCQQMGIVPKSELDLNRFVSKKSPSEIKAVSVEKHNRSETSGLSLQLKVRDMWCPACAWVIDQALKQNPGVVDVSCNFSTDRLRCDYNPVEISPEEIINVIEGLGYKTAVPGEAGAKEKRVEFTRFTISAFLTINIMMLSFALYAGFFTELSTDAISKLSWPIFFMASMVLFYGGQNIFKKAFAGFISAGSSMETLIAVGSLSAYIYSVIILLNGGIHLYFDTASMLITLVLLGKMLERGAKNKVQEDLENFFSLKPTKVKLVTTSYPDGRYVAAEQLRQGDIFVVQNDEVVPADGRIINGSGVVDESSLTGEALPVARKPGDRIRSGTKVIRGHFRVKAEGVGQDSILGQMIGIMEKALGQKTPLEGKTDRLLRGFVPVILILAVGTGIVCRYMGISLESSLIRSVTVMVISCPCALGVAIPLARVAGISVAGRMGILVRDFAAFEQAAKVDAFVFDKTGTVTQGRWELIKIISFNRLSESQVLSLAVALEMDSDHYIAIQIKQQAAKRWIEPAEIRNITTYENGISGWIGENVVNIGSKNFLSEKITASGCAFSIDFSQFATEPSLVYMGYAGKLAAVFVFGDVIRESAPATLKQLQVLGNSLAIVSGDGQKTTRAIGQKVNINSAYGGMLPAAKADFIEKLRIMGNHVAMVGDGVNDAPALARADLAVAVHSESHLGKEVADLTLMRGEPSQILDFLKLAKRVNQKVHQNLICSFIYNILSIPIAMSGLLTPLVLECHRQYAFACQKNYSPPGLIAIAINF